MFSSNVDTGSIHFDKPKMFTVYKDIPYTTQGLFCVTRLIYPDSVIFHADCNSITFALNNWGDRKCHNRFSVVHPHNGSTIQLVILI